MLLRVKLHRLAAFASCALGLMPLASCRSAAATSTETALARALISDDQEKALGQQVHGELDKQGVHYVTDPTVVNYVNRVAAPVLAAAAKERPNMDWHVHVVDDPKTVNAFATPGGHMYLYTGLLKGLKSEHELAGVLGHESAHVIARHSARAMVDQFGLEALAQLALGKDPGLLAKVAAQVVGTGSLLYHSRGAELEADQIGARVTAAAGYDPRGLVSFLHTLKAKEGNTSEVLTWLSTHPASQERIAALDQLISQKGWGGQVAGNPTELASMQQSLGGGSAPAAPAPSQPALQGPTRGGGRSGASEPTPPPPSPGRSPR